MYETMKQTNTLKKLLNTQIPQTPKTTRFYSKFPLGWCTHFWRGLTGHTPKTYFDAKPTALVAVGIFWVLGCQKILLFGSFVQT
jgi:hypothetical protein